MSFNKKLRILSALLFVFAPTLASAATYYVAPGGSDSNPGTQALPFATLQKGHDVAVAGDTIIMRGGTYTPGAQTLFTRAGASGSPITVENFAGELPTISGASIPNNASDPNWVIRMQPGADWWHIKGIEIKDNHFGGGLVTMSSNNIIEMLNVHHNGNQSSWAAAGIAVWDFGSVPINNTILNNDSHHNKDIDNGDADGIEIKHNVGGSGHVVRGNRVWRNSDDGIDFWNSNGIVAENNWVFENGFNDSLQPLGDGQGFKLGGTGSGDGLFTLKNNVVWGNKATGILDNLADLAITLDSNTSWNNGEGNFSFGSGDVLRNNLSFGTLGSVAGASSTTNSWNVSVTVDSADFQSLTFDSTCVLGPRQADGSLPVCPFLRLATGSDLIDKGTDVGLPFNGAAPDLGAFEHVSGGGDVTPPTISMTAPAAGATVSGTATTVSANASDNVGVVGVQFKLDGANLGSEDTTSPYSIAWDTTSATNCSHTLTAVARDAAGNSTTSAGVSVTVSNAVPDATPPTVSITAPAAGATAAGTSVTVSATASDNVGVVGVQFKLDCTNLGAEDTTSPYSVTWDSTTVTNSVHTITAVARDATGNTAKDQHTITANNAQVCP